MTLAIQTVNMKVIHAFRHIGQTLLLRKYYVVCRFSICIFRIELVIF